MLNAFDAAFHNLPEPVVDTPLKMLPRHTAPPVVRPSVHAQRATDEPRNLMFDTYLHCTDVNANLGLIKERAIVDENSVAFMTPLGRFVVRSSTGCIVRGKLQKRSQ